jgi:hypothetical protein
MKPSGHSLKGKEILAFMTVLRYGSQSHTDEESNNHVLDSLPAKSSDRLEKGFETDTEFQAMLKAIE